MRRIRSIDYEDLVQSALRVVVRDVLLLTEKNGLIGEHHFYISFATDYPGVVMPDYLRDEYPDEMTIVLQHEFWDLKNTQTSFDVVLCFDDKNEQITIPYEAITSFADPSVQFGLQFTPEYEIEEEVPVEKMVKKDKKEKKEKLKEPIPTDGSNVVSLDIFRKK